MSAGRAICVDCKRPFEPKQPHHRRCEECQRKTTGGGWPAAQGRFESRDGGALPADYLQGGYFDEQGKIRREVVIDSAVAVAQLFAQQGITTAQVRQLYHKARFVEAKLAARYRDFDFAQARVELFQLQRDAVWSAARDRKNEPLKQFVERNVALATADERALDAFVEHFQSVVAYLKYYGRDER
jgi:CRISPR type III-A-associated protein Csm2